MWYEILKERRLKAGLTQKELSNLIGVTASTVNNAEGGRALVSDDVISRLQNYFLLGVCGRIEDESLEMRISNTEWEAERQEE